MSPRRFLQQRFKHRPDFSNHRLLGWIAHRLHDPELWHFGRRSVAGGVGVGFFLAFVPVPIQMLIAPVFALLLRVNLPITVAALWISNPLTIAPMFIFAYKVGGWLTGAKTDFVFEPTISGIGSALDAIWYPLLVGCFVCGISAAAVGNVSVRWLWRAHLLWRRRQRRLRREQSRRDAAGSG